MFLLRIPIVGGYILFLTWRLIFLDILHTLLNNSVTVKARATKFNIPRPILPGKGSVLFLTLCDLAPLPWHKVATCDVNTIT